MCRMLITLLFINAALLAGCDKNSSMDEKIFYGSWVRVGDEMIHQMKEKGERARGVRQGIRNLGIRN